MARLASVTVNIFRSIRAVPLSRLERMAASAAAGRVRIVDLEAGALEGRHIVDLDTLQVGCAEPIHQDLESVHGDDLVAVLLLLLEHEAILHPRAAAALH